MAIPYRRPVSPASEERLKEIIQRLKAFGKHHGADPKSWFYDFDKNNKGKAISYCLYNLISYSTNRLGQLQSVPQRNASESYQPQGGRLTLGQIR